MAASSKVIGQRYARALWEVAADPKVAREWLSSLSDLSNALIHSQELEELIKNPVFTFDEKWSVFDALSKEFNAAPKLIEFLKYVTKVNRLGALPAIAAVFKERVLKSESSLEATVESAIALNDSQLKDLKIALEKYSGKKIYLQMNINPQLMAGLRIQLMGKTLDASFQSTLERFRRVLVEAEA